MNRQHPLFSPLGCLGALVLIAGVMAAVAVSGGAIFSPGPLTSVSEKAATLKGFKSHADFQNDCAQCHAPLAGITAERCEACHTNINVERTTSAGLHGKLQAAVVARCQNCHSDHHGSNFNPILVAFQKFDHAVLGFTLDHHIIGYDGTPLTCQTCHTGGDYTFQAATCVKCHGAKNADFMLGHTLAFGQDCKTCHDGADRTAGFDHAKTKFALTGQHAALACTSCHKAAVAPQDAPTNCAGCHTEPPAHAGVFSKQDCGVCHNTNAWTPAKLASQPVFQHTDTKFQLINHQKNFDGKAITCTDCHTQAAAGDFSVNIQTCVNCHSTKDATFMQQHVQQYGPNCVSCHDGAGNMKNFDHAKLFPLEGKHAGLECTACHVDQNFQGASSACVACHAEPAIHAGLFGTQCQSCHSTTAWAPAQLTQHTFPLDHGGKGEVSCQTCHVQTYTAYTCYGCHEHDPQEIKTSHAAKGIADNQLANCFACHANGQKQGAN